MVTGDGRGFKSAWSGEDGDGMKPRPRKEGGSRGGLGMEGSEYVYKYKRAWIFYIWQNIPGEHVWNTERGVAIARKIFVF